MAQPKDLFSQHSREYALFRPSYPKELYDFVFSHVNGFDCAWDCGTGNGQAAIELSDRFKRVNATDISAQQIENAAQRANIFYSVSPAEETIFGNNTFDLITVAQAIHWFDFDRFYSEVSRVAKPNAVLAVWGYGLLSVDATIDKDLAHFYTKVVGPYWESERRFIDANYETIPFPFKEVKSTAFTFGFEWTVEQLKGYLETWSAVRKFIKVNHFNPVDELMDTIRPNWTTEKLKVTFPLFSRVGIVEK